MCGQFGYILILYKWTWDSPEASVGCQLYRHSLSVKAAVDAGDHRLQIPEARNENHQLLSPQYLQVPVDSYSFFGRSWTKIQSDNCFETVSAPGLLLDGFFPALCDFCIGFHRFAKSQWAGKVFSGGFVSKTLRWISFQPH